ncbi:MAG: neuromedin U [Fibrobacter sp.]|nr:neuromedin U [Fibrobacter sp.]
MVKIKKAMTGFCLITIVFISLSQTQEAHESKIRAAQNPIADRTFFGIQNYTGFGIGPNDRVNNILNIQPVVVFPLGSSWNLTTRLILPLSYQPDIFSSSGGNFGLGDVTTAFYFNQRTYQPFVWGIGPTFLFPTATDNSLGADKWGVGASVIAEYNKDNWLAGIILNNTWSFAGLDNRPDINLFTMQPFINFIIPNTNGLTVITSPVITANWEIDDDRWTVPLGGGLGYLFQFGNWSTFLTVQGYGSVTSPAYSPDWNLIATAQLLFPKNNIE